MLVKFLSFLFLFCLMWDKGSYTWMKALWWLLKTDNRTPAMCYARHTNVYLKMTESSKKPHFNFQRYNDIISSLKPLLYCKCHHHNSASSTFIRQQVFSTPDGHWVFNISNFLIWSLRTGNARCLLFNLFPSGGYDHASVAWSAGVNFSQKCGFKTLSSKTKDMIVLIYTQKYSTGEWGGVGRTSAAVFFPCRQETPLISTY